NVERAVLALRAVLDSDEARHVTLRTEVGAVDHEANQPLAAGINEVNWTVTVERPELWWPRALGPGTLHATRVAVLAANGTGSGTGGDGEGSGRAVSDERRLRTGLRSVRVRAGVWSVNGERIFVKGTALGPTRPGLADAEPGEV